MTRARVPFLYKASAFDDKCQGRTTQGRNYELNDHSVACSSMSEFQVQCGIVNDRFITYLGGLLFVALFKL